VPGCFLSHRRPGLPDPTDIGPRIDLAVFEVVRFPGHPLHHVSGAKGLQSRGTSSLRQGGSGPSNVGWRLTGCNDLGKGVGANNYLAGRRKSSSRSDWRDNRRCIRRTTSIGSCVVKSCQKVVKKVSKRCQKVVKKLSKSWQKIVIIFHNSVLSMRFHS
jgi:hypothetical protein